jgi:transposase
MQETFQECTKKAFEYFGGIPKTILYDKLKSVVIQRDKYGKNQHGFNENFLDFAKTYKFIPKICKPYRAQTKGKVERFNDYLKGNFF